MTSTILFVFFIALQPISYVAFKVSPECDFGRTVSKTPNTSLPDSRKCSYMGGLFSVHRDRRNPFNAMYSCSPSDFHRFGVEQAEALIFAYELLNNSTDISGYSIYDSCGLMPPIDTASPCVEDQARALRSPDEKDECALVTIVGPFYRGGDEETVNSVVYGSSQLLALYEGVFGSGQDKRGVFSLVDEPIGWIPDDDFGSSSDQIVFMQASCDLQARAAVDVLLSARWERVLVVVSGDACGNANKGAFQREIDTRQLECSLNVEYYEHSTNVVGKRDLSNVFNRAGSLKDLWRRCLDEPDSPRAIVVLSSIPFAFDFFHNGYFGIETKNRTSFSFLLGDFWGNPARVDDLYDVLMRVTETANTVIALNTITNGLDKFQDHMTSIRANSTELERNSLLAGYWENFFNCSLSKRTCDNTTSLPNVNRPILRNYKASLVIDSVFLLHEYLRGYFEAQTIEAPFVLFETLRSIFHKDTFSITTNVSSWTGNQVRIDNVDNGFSQPTFWSYEIIAWTRKYGRNQSFPYGVWTFNDEDTNRTTNLQLNEHINVTIWAPKPLLPYEICPTTEPLTSEAATTPSPIEITERAPTSTTNKCTLSAVLPAIATPIIVLLLHIVVLTLCLCVFGLASTRECIVPTPTIFLALLTLASFLVSLLVAVNVFSPFECKTLALDFVVNFLSVLCLAPFFVETLGHLVGGMINRLQIKILLVAVLIIFEIVLAGIASFRFLPDDNVDDFNYKQCLNARSQILPIISYWINAVLALGTVIIIWVTYGKGYRSRLKNSLIVECGVATFLAILYIVAISIVLWVNDCKTQAQWLVVLAAFPGFMTCYIVTFMAWSRHSVSKRRKSLPGEIPGSYLSRDPSHHYVDKMGNSFAMVVGNYWEEDIIAEITGVVISPSRIKQEDRIGKGNFGEVFKGLMDTNVLVALKSVQDAMNRKEVNDFVREGLQMRDFKHPNVMELYGICWSEDPTHPNHRSPFIILPYMELGDLKMYLRKCRPGNKSAEDRPKQLSLVQLVKFCHQVAKGMNYISDKACFIFIG
ncbi:uncharacterized protein [Oscarella lobularis]|uniref:uncharacterized protein isoform X2 n=1 Tax=Oscarella lobularis TaxID=121494 RepID=UPI0033143934